MVGSEESRFKKELLSKMVLSTKKMMFLLIGGGKGRLMFLAKTAV